MVSTVDQPCDAIFTTPDVIPHGNIRALMRSLIWPMYFFVVPTASAQTAILVLGIRGWGNYWAIFPLTSLLES